MLFVAAASAASSPCAGSSLFFCEDFGAGRDGWVEGRGDAKQFASHKHPWPASVAKADDAGVLLDRRLGCARRPSPRTTTRRGTEPRLILPR